MQIIKYLAVAVLAATTFTATAAPAEAFSIKRTIRQVIGGNRYNPYYGNYNYGNNFNNNYGWNQFNNPYNNGYFNNNYYGGGRSTVRRLVDRLIGW
jgi:hypothetical protein